MLRYPIVFVKNAYAALAFAWSWCWFQLRAWLLREEDIYVELELADDYTFGPPGGLARYLRDQRSFLELREDLRRLAASELVDGFLIRKGGAGMGLARADALRGLLDEASAQGNRVVSHLQMAPTNRYLVHAAADTILLTPAGHLHTFGPRLDQFFAQETIEDLGLAAQFVHIGEFKTAAHRVLHSDMTPPQELMMQSVHGGLHATLSEQFAEARTSLPGDGSSVFARAPLGGRRARDVGAVDHLVSEARLAAWLRSGGEALPTNYGGGPEPEPPPDDDPDEAGIEIVGFDGAEGLAPPTLEWTPVIADPKRIAVVDLTGMIVMPDMQIPGSSGPVVDPDPVVPVLQHVRDSAEFQGLLLHVNSPGGSALASEIIGEAIEEVKREKPVAAYCTDVAASGGYYLASSAETIVSHELTVTGSIGVVVGKLSAPGVPEKLGVTVESIHEHDADTFTSLLDPLSDDLFERLGEDARNFYRRFLRRVGSSRGLRRRRLHRYARGRVYTGRQARDRELVDRLGGFQAALEAVCEPADLDPDRAEVAFAPHRQPGIGDMLGLPMASNATGWCPESLAEPALAARMLNREGMLALAPFDLDVGQGA